jgi:GNAT superfamily N-acetyltransferase
MREPPILTTELTSQLERHSAPKETSPSQAHAEIVRFGNTIASKERETKPYGQVFCFNGDDVGRLDEILAFFGDMEARFFLGHAGFESKVGQALNSASYYIYHWKHTALYGLPADEPAMLPAGVTIELVTNDTVEVAAEITAEGRGWPEPRRESEKNDIRQSIHQEHHHLYLARYEGEPAGAGNLSRSNASDQWCGFGGGAVIPRFRGQGIHTALLQHRLHVAYQLGYELVVSRAQFGSTSFRNQQRVGLRLAYIESRWKKRQ